jgi:hypothetical protein
MQTTVAMTPVTGLISNAIKVESLGVPVSVNFDGEEAAVEAKLELNLAALEKARINWENNELAASNKKLYSILSVAYSYYHAMKIDGDKDSRKVFKDEMDTFIKQRKYIFNPGTHDMTKVVKCVFGMDRRRVSAYSIALREALRQEVPADELVDFIEENGGVEQIRLGGDKSLSATQRAAIVLDDVLGTELGLIKFDSADFVADADWSDKQVVIVATYLPTGEFQANAVVRHDTAVNTALAAFYSQQQQKQRDQAKAERDAEKVSKAAFEQALKAQKKFETMQKQIATVKTLVKTAAEQAAFNTHFNNLFEATQA